MKLYRAGGKSGPMDQSSITQNRRSRRSPVFLAATVEVAGVPQPVKLRNLSEEGALIEGDRLPLEGTTTFFERNDLRLKSRVVWVCGTYAGVAFARPLRSDEVLRNVPQPRQRQNADFRRPGLACRPLTDQERRMVEKWMVSSPMGSPGD
jgi:PilZ domain